MLNSAPCTLTAADGFSMNYSDRSASKAQWEINAACYATCPGLAGLDCYGDRYGMLSIPAND